MVRQNVEVKRVTSPAPPEQVRQSPAPGPRRGIASAWGPLREPLFRALWVAAVASNVGTWMEDVGESWLMMSLSPSPLLVALLQTSDAIPIILLSLPSGALADVIGSRAKSLKVVRSASAHEVP